MVNTQYRTYGGLVILSPVKMQKLQVHCEETIMAKLI